MADQKPSVLVVEDDPQLNQLVGAYAQIAGFEYRKALDGTTGLREAHERAPSAVILDLMLPDIDGFEICKQLKHAPDTEDIPVIIVSAMSSEKDQQRGRDCGAVEYLVKPFDPDQLMWALSHHAKSPV
jgi:two-component system response regulator RpaA